MCVRERDAAASCLPSIISSCRFLRGSEASPPPAPPNTPQHPRPRGSARWATRYLPTIQMSPVSSRSCPFLRLTTRLTGAPGGQTGDRRDLPDQNTDSRRLESTFGGSGKAPPHTSDQTRISLGRIPPCWEAAALLKDQHLQYLIYY